MHAWPNALQVDVVFSTLQPKLGPADTFDARFLMPTFDASVASSSQTSQLYARLTYSTVRIIPYTRRESEKGKDLAILHRRDRVNTLLHSSVAPTHDLALPMQHTLLHPIPPPAYRPNRPILSQGIWMMERDVRREEHQCQLRISRGCNYNN